MTKTLREQLIGAWKLVSYVEKPVDGSAPSYPMGEKPEGIIMYTPDGYMSAQLERAGRPPFASGDWFRGTVEEVKEEAAGYIAYCGPFQTDEEKQQLTHSMFVSLFPNWIGQNATARGQDRGRYASSEHSLADQVGRKRNQLISDLEAGGAQ